MDVVGCELVELAEGLVGLESAVGVEAEFDIGGGKTLADVTDEFKFLVKTDGADFEFHAMVTCFQLCFEAPHHRREIAHPDQSVDHDTCFASTERSVEKAWRAGL